MLILALLTVTTLEAGCLPAGGDWISAGEMAQANPAFAALAPGTRLGASPSVGARRVFHSEELRRLARVHHLAAGALREVCFAWPAAVPDPLQLAAAMARVLRCEASAIEVVEQSRFPLPPGEFEFDRRKLTPQPGSEGQILLWRGSLRYGGNRRSPVWARVRIVLPAMRVRALTPIAPGQPIGEAQVELEHMPDAFFGGDWAGALDEVVGRVSRVRVEKGALIHLNMLAIPPDVAAGEKVEVEVRNGRLRVRAEARAERSGRVGEVVPLTNLSSGTRMAARIEAKGKVSVVVR